MLYRIEMLVDGRWCPLGGKFTRTEADRKIVEFMATSARGRERQFRIVPNPVRVCTR